MLGYAMGGAARENATHAWRQLITKRHNASVGHIVCECASVHQAVGLILYCLHAAAHTEAATHTRACAINCTSHAAVQSDRARQHPALTAPSAWRAC